MKFILLFVSFLIVGCNSTPYSDDYTMHENTLQHNERNKALTYVFAGDSDFVDVRGIYDNDNTAGSTNLLYVGDAGLIGLVAQIGVHAAMKNEARDSRLEQLQNQANATVQDLIDFSAGIVLSDLLGQYGEKFKNNDLNLDSHSLFVKPIFFSNEKKTMLHMRMVAWIPAESKKRKAQYKYRNAVQVYSHKFSEEETAKILSDPAFLSQQLSELLQMGLFMLENDINGEFDAVLKAKKEPSKSYVIGDMHSRVYRANLVTSRCEFDIIKDLHSWLIAYKVEDRDNCES